MDVSLLSWSNQDHCTFDHKFNGNVWQLGTCAFLRLYTLAMGSSQPRRPTSKLPSSCLHRLKVSISCLDQIKKISHLWMLNYWGREEWQVEEKTWRWIKREHEAIDRKTKYHHSVLRMIHNSAFLNTKGKNWLGRNNKGKTNSWRKKLTFQMCMLPNRNLYIFILSIKDHRCMYVWLE